MKTNLARLNRRFDAVSRLASLTSNLATLRRCRARLAQLAHGIATVGPLVREGVA